MSDRILYDIIKQQGDLEQEIGRLAVQEYMQARDPKVAYSRLIPAGMALGQARGLWVTNVDWSYEPKHLSTSGSPLITFDDTVTGLPIAHIDLIASSSQYLYHADDSYFDITGTESYVASAWRGLGLWAWIYMDGTQTNTDPGIMMKWDASGSQRSYLLHMNSSDYLVGAVSSDGGSTNVTTITHTVTIPADCWSFVALTFDPSASLNIWCSDSTGVLRKASETSGVEASIYNGTAPLMVGAWGTTGSPSNYADMKFSAGGIYCHLIPDATIEWLYATTRAAVDC